MVWVIWLWRISLTGFRNSINLLSGACHSQCRNSQGYLELANRPSKYGTRISILGFRIPVSEAHNKNKKEKRKALLYELSKSKRVRYLFYETVTGLQRRSDCYQENRNGKRERKVRHSKYVSRKANIRKLLSGRTERRCSIATGSYSPCLFPLLSFSSCASFISIFM